MQASAPVQHAVETRARLQQEQAELEARLRAVQDELARQARDEEVSADATLLSEISRLQARISIGVREAQDAQRVWEENTQLLEHLRNRRDLVSPSSLSVGLGAFSESRQRTRSPDRLDSTLTFSRFPSGHRTRIEGNMSSSFSPPVGLSSYSLRASSGGGRSGSGRRPSEDAGGGIASLQRLLDLNSSFALTPPAPNPASGGLVAARNAQAVRAPRMPGRPGVEEAPLPVRVQRLWEEGDDRESPVSRVRTVDVVGVRASVNAEPDRVSRGNTPIFSGLDDRGTPRSDVKYFVATSPLLTRVYNAPRMPEHRLVHFPRAGENEPDDEHFGFRDGSRFDRRLPSYVATHRVHGASNPQDLGTQTPSSPPPPASSPSRFYTRSPSPSRMQSPYRPGHPLEVTRPPKIDPIEPFLRTPLTGSTHRPRHPPAPTSIGDSVALRLAGGTALNS